MEQLAILKTILGLEPHAEAIEGRHNDVIKKETELVAESGSLNAFANAHHFFGLHRTKMEAGCFVNGLLMQQTLF